LLLNVMCCLVVLIMVLAVLRRKRVLIKVMNFKKGYYDWVFLLLVYTLSTVLMILFFSLFSNIVKNSQWNLNILALPTFDHLKAISLVIIFLAGAGYVLFTIIGLNMVLYKNPSQKTFALKVLVAFGLSIAVVLSFID